MDKKRNKRKLAKLAIMVRTLGDAFAETQPDWTDDEIRADSEMMNLIFDYGHILAMTDLNRASLKKQLCYALTIQSTHPEWNIQTLERLAQFRQENQA